MNFKDKIRKIFKSFGILQNNDEEVEDIYRRGDMTFKNLVVSKLNEEGENTDAIVSFEDKTEETNNPLKSIPESKMRLYAFIGLEEKVFFDSKEEQEEYKKNIDTYLGNSNTIDYLGQMACETDVFRIIFESGTIKYYTALDTYRIAIYNEQQSIEEGCFVWDVSPGDLSEVYSAFRKRGINFENDVYNRGTLNQDTPKQKRKKHK